MSQLLTRSFKETVRSSGYSHFCCGSLPFRDVQEALSFILANPFVLPFWPELPCISEEEGMLKRAERGYLAGWNGYAPAEALGLYGLKHRLEFEAKKLKIVKCQLTGPLSLVTYSSSGAGSWQDRFSTAVEICLRQISWQADFLKGVAESFLFVIDEPALVLWQELDEKKQAAFFDAFSVFCVEASERRGFFGVHTCCAHHNDFLSLPVDLYSFDALGSGHGCVSEQSVQNAFRKALSRGLVIAPGVFPAVPDGGFEEAVEEGNGLAEEYRRALELEHSDPALMYAANCGHGTADPGWVKFLYKQDRLKF